MPHGTYSWHEGKGAKQCLTQERDLNKSCLLFLEENSNAAQQEAIKVSNAEEFCFLGDPVTGMATTGQSKSLGEKVVIGSKAKE